MKKRTAVISIAQIRYYDNAEKHNIAKIKKYITLAKKRKSDIICFPESCIQKKGFVHFNHTLVNEIKEECKKNSIWCIIGDDTQIGKKFYNTAMLINRQGKIVGHYKKINLMGEGYGSPIKPGKQVKVFKTDFGKIGMAICWDLTQSSLFEKMKKKGAEIVFVPAYWKYELHAHHTRTYNNEAREKERKILKSMAMTRAFENLMFVALCNPAKNADEIDLVPCSVICSPHKMMGELKDKEGIITAKLDLSDIKRFEKLYKEAE